MLNVCIGFCLCHIGGEKIHENNKLCSGFTRFLFIYRLAREISSTMRIAQEKVVFMAAVSMDAVKESAHCSYRLLLPHRVTAVLASLSQCLSCSKCREEQRLAQILIGPHDPCAQCRHCVRMLQQTVKWTGCCSHQLLLLPCYCSANQPSNPCKVAGSNPTRNLIVSGIYPWQWCIWVKYFIPSTVIAASIYIITAQHMHLHHENWLKNSQQRNSSLLCLFIHPCVLTQ